jgi:NADH:ubiquinone reductase (H+-translocating)
MNQCENHGDGCGGAEDSADTTNCVSRVLSLGGGFGGIYAAIELERALRARPDVTVTLLTRDNCFLFTPMLHEVAASDLEMNTIINPLRKILRRVKNFTGNIERINLERRCVAVTHGFDHHAHELSYDHLKIALGSSTNFFGLPGLQDATLTIKTLDDAIELRNHIITHLEEASSECAAGQRQPLLTFVVVGPGFAGVETFSGINDFVREAILFIPTSRRNLSA